MAQAADEEARSPPSASAEAGLHPGDHVSWRYGVGEAIGQVVEKITEDKRIGARTFHASPEDPRYLVKSDSSGKEAVRKAEALHKLTPEEEVEARHRHEAAHSHTHHSTGPRSPRRGVTEGTGHRGHETSHGGPDPTYQPDPREDMMSVEADEAALRSLPPDDKLLS